MSETDSRVRAIHVDSSLVAFDKPSGLLTIPGRTPEESLWRLAEAARGERLWPVHRLDRETSGLVLFARTAQVHRNLSMAFESRSVEKRYLAQVAPLPLTADGTLESSLVPARRGFMREARPGEKGVLAQTSYRVLEAAGDRALVELRPITGRTHQLRLQLAALGSPIVGELHYRRLEPLVIALAAPRLWLHAARVALAHPLDGSDLVIEVDRPEGLWPPVVESTVEPKR